MHMNSKYKHVCKYQSYQVCGLRGIDSWTTKTQMSAVKLYTAQGGRLTHLQIHK